MYTLVVLERGYLRTSLVGVDGETVDRSRWRDAIGPAISLLRSFGGGGTLVHHRPGDLSQLD